MKNKNIKELRMGVGTDPSVSPIQNKKSRSAVFNRSADNYFGGEMGIGRTFKGYEPEDFLTDDELDEELLQEFKLPNLKSLLSAVGNIPVFGSVANALQFLLAYFGPTGLQAALTSFTKNLNNMFFDKNVLGNDFLEAESDSESAGMSDQEINNKLVEIKNILDLNLSDDGELIKNFNEKIKEISSNDFKPSLNEMSFAERYKVRKGHKKIKYLYSKNNLAGICKELQKDIYKDTNLKIEKNEMPLIYTTDIHLLRGIIKNFDDIGDQLQYCFLAFTKIFSGIFAQLAFSLIEPIDFIQYLCTEYLQSAIKMMEKAYKDETIKEIASYIGKPLNALGHFDLFINIEKIKRLELVLQIVKKLKKLETKIVAQADASKEKLGDEASDGEKLSEKEIGDITNFILQTIFESDTNKRGIDKMILNERKRKENKFSLLETLENISDQIDEEESFEEIDLEEYSGTGVVAGITGPLGNEKNEIKNYESIQKEQIERMRILEAYHQKTTNRLK